VQGLLPIEESEVEGRTMSDGMAVVIVHWPGKDVPACETHAEQLCTVALVMGFRVSSTPATGPIPCSNCENKPK
jgi:hypothetical protein